MVLRSNHRFSIVFSASVFGCIVANSIQLLVIGGLIRLLIGEMRQESAVVPATGTLAR